MNAQIDEHLRLDEQSAVKNFLGRLQRLYAKQVLRAVLFGSKARGESHPDSDIDILLIVNNEDWRFRRQISGIAADTSLEYDVLIGPIVISQDRWELMKREKFSLCENVARDGIPLAF